MKAILKFFQKLFGPKSVDQITSRFNKMVVDLTRVEDESITRRNEIAVVISNLSAEQDQLIAEADRAKSVRERIQFIVQ